MSCKFDEGSVRQGALGGGWGKDRRRLGFSAEGGKSQNGSLFVPLSGSTWII